MPVALIAECVLCTDIERGVTFNVLAVVRVDGLFLLTPVSPEHPLSVAPFYVRSIEQNKNNDDSNNMNNNNESFFFSQSPLPGGSNNNNNNSALKKQSWLEVPLFQQQQKNPSSVSSSSSKLMKIFCMTGPQQKRELEFDEVKYEHKDYLSSAYTPDAASSSTNNNNNSSNNNNLVSTQWRLVRHVDLATLVSIHWTMASMNNNNNNNSNTTSTKSPFAPLCLSLWFRMLQKGNVCPLQNIELAPTPYNLFSSSNNSNLLKSNNNNSNGNEDVLAEALRIRNPSEYVLNFGLNGICRAIELVCYLYKPNVRLPVLLAYVSRVGEDESEDDQDEKVENARSNSIDETNKPGPSTKPNTALPKKYKTKPISSTSSPAYDATFGSILAHALRPRKFNNNNNNNNNTTSTTIGAVIRPSAPTDLLPQNHSTLSTQFISKSKCPTPGLWRETKDSWLERCRAVADVSGPDSIKLLELSALTNAAKVPLTLAMWDKANTVGIPSPVNSSALFDSRALVRLQQFIIASAALLEKSRTATVLMPINVNGKAVESVLQRVKEYLIHVCLQCPAPAFQNAFSVLEDEDRNNNNNNNSRNNAAAAAAVELPFCYPTLTSNLTGIRLDLDGNIRFPENLSQLQKQQLMQPIKKNNNNNTAAGPSTSASISTNTNTIVCGSFMISPLGICFSPPVTPTSAALQEFEEISTATTNNNNNNKNDKGKPQMNYAFLPLTSLVEVVGFKDEVTTTTASDATSNSTSQNKNNSKSSSPNSKTVEGQNNSLTRREGTPSNNTSNPQQIMQNLYGHAYGPSSSSSTSRWRNVVIFRFADPVSGHIQNYCLLLNRDDDDSLVSSTTSSGNGRNSNNGSDKNSSDGRSPSALSTTENADGGNEMNTTQLRTGTSSSIARRREEQLLQQDPFYVVASQVNIPQLYSKKTPHIFRILSKLCARVGVSLAVTSIAVSSPLTVLTNLMTSSFFQALIVSSSSSSPLTGNSSIATNNNSAFFAPSNVSFAPSSFGGSIASSPVLTSTQKSLLVQRATELLISYPFKTQNLVVRELIGASSIKSILNNNNNSKTSSPLSPSVVSTPFTPTNSNNNTNNNTSSPAWSLSSELPAPSALSAFATHRTIFIRICERKSRFGFWNERALVILVDRKTPAMLLMQKSNERQDAFPSTSSTSPGDQNQQQLSEDEIASTRLLIVDLSTNQVTDSIGARDVVAVTVSSDRRPPAIREALWFPEGISLNYIKRDANSNAGSSATSKNNEDLAIEDFDESDAATPRKMQAGDKDKLFTLREVTKERMLQLYGPCSYQKPWPRLSTLNDVFAFIKDPNRYYKRRAASRITASMILDNNSNNNVEDDDNHVDEGSGQKRKLCCIVSGPPMRHDPRLVDFAPRAFNFFASVGSTRLVRLIEVRKADDGTWKERVLVVAANYNNPRSISSVCSVNERPLNYSVFICALNGTVEVVLDAASNNNNNSKTPILQVKNAALTGTGANRKSPAKQVMEWHTSGLVLTVVNLNHKKKNDTTKKLVKQNIEKDDDVNNNTNVEYEEEEEHDDDDESQNNIEIILREVGAQRMLAVYGQPTAANLWPRVWKVSEMCEWISPEEEEDRLLKEEKKKRKQENVTENNDDDGQDQKQENDEEVAPRVAPKRTLDGQLVSRTAKQKVQNAVRAMKMFGLLGKKIGVSAEEEENLQVQAELETIKKQKDEENAAITEAFLSKIKEQEERRQKESDEIAARRQEELNRQQTEKDLLQQRLQEAEMKLQTQEEKFRDSNTDMLQKFVQLQSRMSEVESAAREERVQAEVVKIRERALFSCQEQESMNRRLLQDDVQSESFAKIQELFDELITFPMMRERAIRGHQNQTDRKTNSDRDLGGEEESPHELQQQQQQQQGRNDVINNNNNSDETSDALLALQNNARQQQLEELLISQEGKWRESNSEMLSRFLEQQQRMAEIENNNNSVALQVAAEMRVSAMNACHDQERFLRTMIDQSQEESLDRVEELFLSTMPPKDRRFLTCGAIALAKMENETEADARRALENVEVLQRRKLCVATILVDDSGLENLHRFLEVQRREEVEHLERIQEAFARKVIDIQNEDEFISSFDFVSFQQEKESILQREAEKNKLENDSATKIQSKIRQNQAKSELEKLRKEAEEKAERENSERENKAATVIQCKTRQMLAKNELRSLRERDVAMKQIVSLSTDESNSRQNLKDDESQEFSVAISERFEILSNIITDKDSLIQEEKTERCQQEQERDSSMFGEEFMRDVLWRETEESEAILRNEVNMKQCDDISRLQHANAQELGELREREKTEKENSAATAIQSKIRQVQAKTKLDQLRQEKTQQETSAATKIQSKIRQAQAKKRVSKIRHERDAAVTIQSKVRQNIAKAKANELREEQKSKNESSAATRIQSKVRQNQAKNEANRLRDELKQRVQLQQQEELERNENLEKMEQLNRNLLLQQQLVEMEETERDNISSSSQQHQQEIRAQTLRLVTNLNHHEDEEASRQHIDDEERESFDNFQRQFNDQRSKITEKEKENNAATAIQSKIRQVQAKTKLDQLRQEKTQQETSAATKIQSKIRQAQAKKRVSKIRQERDAAVTIQSKVRQNIAKAKANELREERKSKNESSAATRIQSKVRQNQARTELQRLRNLKEAADNDESENIRQQLERERLSLLQREEHNKKVAQELQAEECSIRVSKIESDEMAARRQDLVVASQLFVLQIDEDSARSLISKNEQPHDLLNLKIAEVVLIDEPMKRHEILVDQDESTWWMGQVKYPFIDDETVTTIHGMQQSKDLRRLGEMLERIRQMNQVSFDLLESMKLHEIANHEKEKTETKNNQFEPTKFENNNKNDQSEEKDENEDSRKEAIVVEILQQQFELQDDENDRRSGIGSEQELSSAESLANRHQELLLRHQQEQEIITRTAAEEKLRQLTDNLERQEQNNRDSVGSDEVARMKQELEQQAAISKQEADAKAKARIKNEMRHQKEFLLQAELEETQTRRQFIEEFESEQWNQLFEDESNLRKQILKNQNQEVDAPTRNIVPPLQITSPRAKPKSLSNTITIESSLTPNSSNNFNSDASPLSSARRKKIKQQQQQQLLLMNSNSQFLNMTSNEEDGDKNAESEDSLARTKRQQLLEKQKQLNNMKNNSHDDDDDDVVEFENYDHESFESAKRREKKLVVRGPQVALGLYPTSLLYNEDDDFEAKHNKKNSGQQQRSSSVPRNSPKNIENDRFSRTKTAFTGYYSSDFNNNNNNNNQIDDNNNNNINVNADQDREKERKRASGANPNLIRRDKGYEPMSEWELEEERRMFDAFARVQQVLDFGRTGQYVIPEKWIREGRAKRSGSTLYGAYVFADFSKSKNNHNNNTRKQTSENSAVRDITSKTIAPQEFISRTPRTTSTAAATRIAHLPRKSIKEDILDMKNDVRLQDEYLDAVAEYNENKNKNKNNTNNNNHVKEQAQEKEGNKNNNNNNDISPYATKTPIALSEDEERRFKSAQDKMDKRARAALAAENVRQRKLERQQQLGNIEFDLEIRARNFVFAAEQDAREELENMISKGKKILQVRLALMVKRQQQQQQQQQQQEQEVAEVTEKTTTQPSHQNCDDTNHLVETPKHSPNRNNNTSNNNNNYNDDDDDENTNIDPLSRYVQHVMSRKRSLTQDGSISNRSRTTNTTDDSKTDKDSTNPSPEMIEFQEFECVLRIRLACDGLIDVTALALEAEKDLEVIEVLEARTRWLVKLEVRRDIMMPKVNFDHLMMMNAAVGSPRNNSAEGNRSNSNSNNSGSRDRTSPSK